MGARFGYLLWDLCRDMHCLPSLSVYARLSRPAMYNMSDNAGVVTTTFCAPVEASARDEAAWRATVSTSTNITDH